MGLVRHEDAVPPAIAHPVAAADAERRVGGLPRVRQKAPLPIFQGTLVLAERSLTIEHSVQGEVHGHDRGAERGVSTAGAAKPQSLSD